MLYCFCGKSFPGRSSISQHVSRLSRSQPLTTHYPLWDGQGLLPEPAEPLSARNNPVAPPLAVSASRLADDDEEEVLAEDADDYYVHDDADNFTGLVGQSPIEQPDDKDSTLMSGCASPDSSGAPCEICDADTATQCRAAAIQRQHQAKVITNA